MTALLITLAIAHALTAIYLAAYFIKHRDRKAK